LDDPNLFQLSPSPLSKRKASDYFEIFAVLELFLHPENLVWLKVVAQTLRKLAPQFLKPQPNLTPIFLLVGIKLKGDRKKNTFSHKGKTSFGNISFNLNFKKIKTILISLMKGI
jgi:hypothetical protein